MDIIQRAQTVLSRNTFVIGTNPVQFSGGPAQPSDPPLALNTPTGAINFYPQRHRAGITLNNLSSTATIWIGTDATVTSAGANAIGMIAPGAIWPAGPFNYAGSTVLYAVASAAGADLYQTEWQ